MERDDDDDGRSFRGRQQQRLRRRRRRNGRRDSDAAPPLACGCSPTARCDCAAEELAAKAAALDDDIDGSDGAGEEEGESSGGDETGEGGQGGGKQKREGRRQRRVRIRQRPPTRSVTPELAPREEGGGPVVEEIVAAPSLLTAGTTTTAAASDRSPSCSNASAAAALAAVAATSSRQLFGIFRPVSQIKRLHIVRHGQSTYNEAVEARGSAFADPRHIFDAPLTALGRRQAGGELRRELSRMNLRVEDTLWIVSPLTRALETFALGCPFWAEGYGLGKGGSGGGGKGDGESAARLEKKTPMMPPRQLAVVVRREVSERLCTSGDIGLPASTLKRNWPALDSLGALDSLPEHWWHGGPDSNCAIARRFGLPERAQELEARVAQFRKWLHSRPEKNVVVVGHSVYFRSLQRSCSAAGAVKFGGGGGGGGGGKGGGAGGGGGSGGPRRGSGGKGGGGGAGATTTLKNCEVATLYF